MALSQEQLNQCMRRSLEDVDLPVVMIDGIHYHAVPGNDERLSRSRMR